MKQIKKYIQDYLQSTYTVSELKSIELVICTEILKLDKMDVYLCKDTNLTEKQRETLTSALERLKNHEPLQYVVGNALFFGNYFKVKPGVLIPRPETEELVELILRDNHGKYRILDIGTGSGCIALSIAKHNKEASVEAWDVSDIALEVAEENNKALEANATIKKCNIFDYQKPYSIEEQFDIIVSNPPYITYAEQQIMEKNVLNWEPELALFVPNDDPLLFYRRIASLGKAILRPQGKLYFEINQMFGEKTVAMLREEGYSDIQLLKDIFGNNRIVSAKFI